MSREDGQGAFAMVRHDYSPASSGGAQHRAIDSKAISTPPRSARPQSARKFVVAGLGGAVTTTVTLPDAAAKIKIMS